MRRLRFRAMGTDVELISDGAAEAESWEALEAAEREIRRLEGLLSRFLPDSELSRLNREGAIVAGPELVEVVTLALAGRESTGGRFDPTVHDAVVAAGYDRSFDLMDRDGPGEAPPGPLACGGRLSVDRAAREIRLEPGARLDLGGIAKGYSADRVSDLLRAAGPCLVNVGGDLAVRGVPRDGTWAVGVETSDGTMSLSLESGAMATSGRDRRRWTRGGADLHHVIDPRTARPAATDLLRATVVSSSAAWAEVLATAFLVAGCDAAGREAEVLGVPCVLVREDATLCAGGLS